jgi:hypothetical protein
MMTNHVKRGFNAILGNEAGHFNSERNKKTCKSRDLQVVWILLKFSKKPGIPILLTYNRLLSNCRGDRI